MAKWRLNICENCGYKWPPRGRAFSIKCPKCRSSDVIIHQNPFEYTLLFHLLIFVVIIYFRTDLNWSDFVSAIKAKRGWPVSTYFDTDEYLSQTFEVFYWSALVHIIAIVKLIRKKIAKRLVQSKIDEPLDLAGTLSTKVSSNPLSKRQSQVGSPKPSQEFAIETRARRIPEYDIAISFAGEDREYAELLARLLKEKNTRVFYDEYEQAVLWGQDLYQYFSEIFQKRAKYCVVFVSAHYVRKPWTRLELKAAQAREFEENSPYILQIKLDDTELPGIPRTVGYKSWQKDGLENIVQCLLAKLKTQA